MKKILVVILMGCALAFAFASCGGDSQDDPTSEQFIPVVDDSVKSVNVPIIPSLK